MKKVFSLLLALSMLITGSFGVMAQAQTIEPTNFDEINFQITSKENPDAYIESRFVPGNSAYARSSEEDGKTLVGYVDATVYVEETYTKGEDGNIFTTDSRLLSEEEVMSLGKSEFDVPVQSVQPRISTIGDKTTSRGKLTIRFTVMAYSQARRYQLNLTSNWSGLSWLSTGDTNSPGWGDDIMGFAWGGGYDFDGYGYDLLDAFGNHGRAAYIQSKANCGVAWNFNEHTTEAEYDDYITRAQCWTNINKNVATGGGNTTSVTGEYLHTWAAVSPSVSWSVSGSGGSASFGLSSPSSQSWSIQAVVTGIPY